MKALDLFCCGGGAGKGLQDAGFTVTGVDVEDRSAAYSRFIGSEFLASKVTA